MILVDTNVVSALMQDRPDIAVVTWMNRQNAEDIWTSTVTVFEVRFGLARMVAGRKRAALEAAFDSLLRQDLAGRIALFDRTAAEAAGQLAARREAIGRTVDVRDTLIAGIALSRRALVASRNVKHFDDLDTGVIDPWAA